MKKKLKISKKVYKEVLEETEEIYKEIISDSKEAIKAFNEDFLINWQENINLVG